MSRHRSRAGDRVPRRRLAGLRLGHRSGAAGLGLRPRLHRGRGPGGGRHDRPERVARRVARPHRGRRRRAVVQAQGRDQASVAAAGVYSDSNIRPARRSCRCPRVTTAGIKRGDTTLALDAEPGTGTRTVRANLERAVGENPTIIIQDEGGYAEAQRSQVNAPLLYLIYALLGLAIVIAVLGIINTLALSVIERTREIGLLRAVGLTRPQLRTMLRLEAVAIALLGAVLGVVVGLAFALALQRSLADDGLDVLAIPGVQLLGFVAVAGIVGVLAALWPGRRAARLDVLRAIDRMRVRPGACPGSAEHPLGAGLDLGVLRPGRAAASGRSSRASALTCRWTPCQSATTPWNRADAGPGPGVLQADEPAHHRGDLRLDVGRRCGRRRPTRRGCVRCRPGTVWPWDVPLRWAAPGWHRRLPTSARPIDALAARVVHSGQRRRSGAGGGHLDRPASRGPRTVGSGRTWSATPTSPSCTTSRAAGGIPRARLRGRPLRRARRSATPT